jgi:hypothetical protein
MKKCIVIGGGADVVGRGLGSCIDAGEFGLVLRVNKPYGSPEDVGSRIDVLVTRWQAWIQKYFPGPTLGCQRVVLNEHLGISAEEMRAAAQEIVHPHVSAGLLACMWALNRGARQVYAIGFGYRRGQGWPEGKVYPDGTVDNNTKYDWPRENRWLENNVTLL